MTPNATAKQTFRANCGHQVLKGERLFMYRERARSYRHASDAGTMYPWTKSCANCPRTGAPLTDDRQRWFPGTVGTHYAGKRIKGAK